jgi:hypothetical protein
VKLIGYGEDALTLWALTSRRRDVLMALGDKANPEGCTVIYRPSFGRKGGPTSSQFGEFDFILGTPTALYLGEAKWDKSPELIERPIRLRDEQLERHKVFEAYYRVWISRQQWDVRDFFEASQAYFATERLVKPTPPPRSTLAQNLVSILKVCAGATNYIDSIRNVLLVTDSSGGLRLSLEDAPRDFALVCISAAESLEDGLIPLADENDRRKIRCFE